MAAVVARRREMSVRFATVLVICLLPLSAAQTSDICENNAELPASIGRVNMNFRDSTMVYNNLGGPGG